MKIRQNMFTFRILTSKKRKKQVLQLTRIYLNKNRGIEFGEILKTPDYNCVKNVLTKTHVVIVNPLWIEENKMCQNLIVYSIVKMTRSASRQRLVFKLKGRSRQDNKKELCTMLI